MPKSSAFEVSSSENALLRERNRLRAESAGIKVREPLATCPNCLALVRADRLLAHVSTRCPKRKSESASESPSQAKPHLPALRKERVVKSRSRRKERQRPRKRLREHAVEEPPQLGTWPREFTDEERQALFERSLLQGGYLCNRR